MSEKFYISWEEFHNQTKLLCEKIKTIGEFDKIIAVSRGGLIPAGIIAYELNIRHVDTVNIRSYDDDLQRKEEDIEVVGMVGTASHKTLVVDDLADSGLTFKILREQFPEAKFVSVYAKEKGVKQVDIFAQSMPDQWLVFPWD